MDSLALVFLGVIALSSLVQGAFLVFLGVSGLKLVRRVGDIQQSLDKEIRPVLDNVQKVTENLATVSAIATEQARRVELLVGDTVARVEDARENMRRAVARPLDSFRDVTAILKGLRRGFDVYQRLGGLQPKRQGASRRYAEDEHLFI
jgi:hypothetical protein